RSSIAAGVSWWWTRVSPAAGCSRGRARLAHPSPTGSWRSTPTSSAEIKASAAEERGYTSQARIIRERWGIGQDIEVRTALADDYEAFLRRVAERLLADATHTPS